jgi:hypothetical protein
MRSDSFADHRNRTTRLQRTRLAPEERLMRRWREQEPLDFQHLSDAARDSQEDIRKRRDSKDE